MLIAAGYIIFIRENMIKAKAYFFIMAMAFAFSCIVFVFVVIKGKLKAKKQKKIMFILAVVLIVFQLVSLPLVNYYSQSFPAWPRGTIYQMPRLSSSIAQTDVGLLMRYYLDGKTLYANENYPVKSHKGFIYITNEYEFIYNDYPILKEDEAKTFYNQHEKLYQTTNVRDNPKLQIAGFRIHLYVNDIVNIDELILLLDEKGTWYFMPPALYEEVFGE